jgi:hypothetical protein
MTDDLNKNSTIWDTDIFDVKPDTSKVKINGDDLSPEDQRLLRKIVQEEKLKNTKQQLADKKQRKEELRKLYRDGVISEPSAEPPVKFNFGRLYDFEK